MYSKLSLNKKDISLYKKTYLYFINKLFQLNFYLLLLEYFKII